jgi:hypothetical protein
MLAITEALLLAEVFASTTFHVGNITSHRADKLQLMICDAECRPAPATAAAARHRSPKIQLLQLCPAKATEEQLEKKINKNYTA